MPCGPLQGSGEFHSQSTKTSSNVRLQAMRQTTGTAKVGAKRTADAGRKPPVRFGAHGVEKRTLPVRFQMVASRTRPFHIRRSGSWRSVMGHSAEQFEAAT